MGGSLTGGADKLPARNELIELTFRPIEDGQVVCANDLGGDLALADDAGAVSGTFSLVADPERLLDLFEGDLDALANVSLVAGDVVVGGVAPFGAFLLEANGVVPGLAGVTSLIVLDDRRSAVEFGVRDGYWVDAGLLASAGGVGLARLRGGVPQLLRLLGGTRTVRSDVLDGTLVGDMAGLSHLSWMLEHPAWLEVTGTVGPLVRGAAWLLEQLDDAEVVRNLAEVVRGATPATKV